jgi:citrate synthase
MIVCTSKEEKMILKDKINAQLPEWRERVRRLLKESGDVQVDEVTVSQVYGGMRNVKALVTDISYVDPNEGIRLRGFTIPELLERLPKAPGEDIPLVGGLYYLLMVGEIPTLDEAMEVENEWKARMDVPQYVFDVLRAMSSNASPMTLFSMGVLAMQGESVFSQAYDEGLRREDYWETTLEDSLNLTAKVPTIAAFIYHLKYKGHEPMPAPDKNQDWAGNFAHMMGVTEKVYEELSRLYFIIHSDHESGNVSAHATHMVASTLSDVYYATSAGLNGLAGPLHGRANQEALRWLMDVYDKYGRVPSKDELRQFAWDTLNSGQVIPGYGHAVLRKTDPRYTALMEFGKKNFKEDQIFSLACLVYDVVPDVLREQGKAKDPWPNVDAISGTTQNAFGVQDCGGHGGCGFYTVMFGVSRILGVTSNVVWARALGQPLERPKSVTTEMLEQAAAKQKAVV